MKRASQGIAGRVLHGGVLLALLVPVCLFPWGLASADTKDALHDRVLAELSLFTNWLQVNDVKGYIGEVGWPSDPADAKYWNALAREWYEEANKAQLWVTVWATGEWWGTDYRLSPYVNLHGTEGVDTARAQASVLEENTTAGGVVRGISVAGGEFGAPSDDPYSSFSNANPGVYDVAYHYDTQATFDYIASVGASVVRIPFRWERLQPRLGEALDRREVQRLKQVVSRADAADLDVILDMHNYGAYYMSNGVQGVRRPIGSAHVPIARFAGVWGRIARIFRTNRAVIGYGLMNEPVGLARIGHLSPSKVWERASQAALTSIRHRGDTTTVMVAGYEWSGVQRWPDQHAQAWIEDEADNYRYEAHHYWDRDHSGAYRYAYDDEVAHAQSNGHGNRLVVVVIPVVLIVNARSAAKRQACARAQTRLAARDEVETIDDG
jgi:hypothetical protein